MTTPAALLNYVDQPVLTGRMIHLRCRRLRRQLRLVADPNSFAYHRYTDSLLRLQVILNLLAAEDTKESAEDTWAREVDLVLPPR